MHGQPYSQPGSYPGQTPPHMQGGSVAQQPYPQPGSGEPPKRRTLFALLDGIPANILIVFGLFLLLLALTVPGCRRAYADSVEADWRLASALLEHDLTQFRDAQEREREQERAAAAANPMAPPDMTANEARRAAALSAEQRRLEDVHDVAQLRREALEASAGVQGLWVHRIVEWLGRLLLLIGLIVVTSQAEGARQKVFFGITLIVLLTSISGINLDFDLGTRVNTNGGEGRSGADVRGSPGDVGR